MRQATLLVADEIYYNLYGKANLQGIYSADLTIPTSPFIATQLLFYFMIETDIAEAFRSLAVEVTLPESEPVRQQVPVTWPIQLAAYEGRTRLFYRHPLLIAGPTLQTGRIDAKVIHESGEISVSALWITLSRSIQSGKAN